MVPVWTDRARSRISNIYDNTHHGFDGLPRALFQIWYDLVFRFIHSLVWGQITTTVLKQRWLTVYLGYQHEMEELALWIGQVKYPDTHKKRISMMQSALLSLLHSLLIYLIHSPHRPLSLHTLQFLPNGGSESNTDQYQQSNVALGCWNLLPFTTGSFYLQHNNTLSLLVFSDSMRFLFFSRLLFAWKNLIDSSH